MSKKKFSETKVGKFLTNSGSKIVDLVGDSLPSTGVLGVLKGLIEKDDVLPQQDKETALKLLEMDLVEMQEVTKRWVADSTGSWLTKNVRPIVLLFLSVSFIIGWFMQINELNIIKELLQIVFVAYFGGRSFEKIKKSA